MKIKSRSNGSISGKLISAFLNVSSKGSQEERRTTRSSNPAMRIFICCSKAFYDRIPSIRRELESAGHTITLPNSFDNPGREDEMRSLGAKEHSSWKARMLRLQEKKIRDSDAILVVNFEKNGQPNYVGGATFLEMFKAFELGKKIFLYNDIPDGMLRDEILGFGPILIKRDLSRVR